jgi:hypothetical protein
MTSPPQFSISLTDFSTRNLRRRPLAEMMAGSTLLICALTHKDNSKNLQFKKKVPVAISCQLILDFRGMQNTQPFRPHVYDSCDSEILHPEGCLIMKTTFGWYIPYYHWYTIWYHMVCIMIYTMVCIMPKWYILEYIPCYTPYGINHALYHDI